MLQWMGGSRRKVTASRKSTQKRQQHFFEQRKRQQQQQEATAVESHNDSPVASAHQKGNRSLDILSLLNVPKDGEECRPACANEGTSVMTNRAPCARSFEAMDTKDHQTSMRSPIVMTDEVLAAAEYVEPTGTRTVLSHQEERESLQSTKKNASTVRNAESKCWGIDSSIQTSILDIIGDDGPTSTLEGKPGNEAHVAFSVEGLGDLGTETPKQSPQQPVRVSCGDKSSFYKAAKKLNFHKNLNNMLDDLEMETECYMQDTKEPTYGKHLDSFLVSEDVLSPLSYTEHDLPPVKPGKHFGAKRWEMNSLHEDRDTNFWNAGSSFLDENIVNEKCGLDWKNGDANILRNISPDFGSKEPQLLPRCQEDITGRYIDLDDGNRRFCSLEEPNRYSSFMCDYKRQATRVSPYVDMEDKRDNFTSLSEESCSSSAVRGWNSASMPSERHIRRYDDDLPWQLNSNAKENLYEEAQDIMTGARRQGEECDRSRKYRRSNAGHSKSPYISQATINEKFNLEDSWLPEEEFPNFPLGNTDPDSFIPGSLKNRHRNQERDPFSSDVQTDLPNSSSYRYSKFEDKTPSKFSPENISLFQPFCSGQSFNTSFSVGGRYRENNRGVPVKSSNSADVADFFGDTEAAFPAPELSAQGSVTEEVGDKLESNPEKISQISPQNLNISQESKSTAGETSIKENGISFCKEKIGIHQKYIITDSSEEDTEETSPPVMIQHEELNTKELQRSNPGPCHQNLKVAVADVGCFVTKPVKDENLKGFEGKTKLIQPSCQVMTVERYVLQLFCVSQGKAAMWDTAKRLS